MMKENFGGVSAAPLGAGYSKIAAGAVPQPRLALPNQRSRSVFRRRGGLWPPAGAHSAPLLRNRFGYTVGEGQSTEQASSEEYRRAGAEGESAEGREKPPWGVPLPRAGLGPAPTKG